MFPWASPIEVVKKHTPEGLPQQFQLCISYRKLNSLLPAVTLAMHTKKGTFALIPLLKINELFTLLKETKHFTALDLCSGYYHIRLDEESILISAFTTVFGKFEFWRPPFGLSQGPDFFIWLIYDLFGLDKTSNQGQGSGYFAYLHVILIYSKTEKEHLQMLDKAFKCLLNARLKIKLSKGSLFKEQIHYLSHLVSGASILPLANKIEALMKLKPQTNIKDIRHFLTLTGYYSIFICKIYGYHVSLKLLNVQIPTFCLDPRMPIQF